MRTCLGDGQIVFGSDQRTFGRIQFVFCIEHVEQAALTDLELLSIGVARLFGGVDIALQRTHLFDQAIDVVIGDGGCLPHIADKDS